MNIFTKKYGEELAFILGHMQHACTNLIHQISHIKERKADFDIVTKTDYEIEKYIIDQINAKYPTDHILSEEYNPSEKIQGRTWTIDPIDGTFNFASNSPLYGIQCALIENNEIVLSAIILPELNETYYAIINQGTYVNDQRIYIDNTITLNRALISVGDYQHSKLKQAKLQHQTIGILYEKVARIRMYGSACIDFSYLASSKTAGAIVLTNNLWDLAPGILIAKEAGALVSNSQGKPYTYTDFGVLVAANKEIQNVIVAAFYQARNM